MVIPFRPDESELWVLIQRNDMPPPGAAPLSEREKAVIHNWIAAGAPENHSIPLASPAIEAVPSNPLPLVIRALHWFGKFHLLLVHFPIALVLGAAVADFYALWQRSSRPSESCRFCLWLAAITVVPTVILGWLLADAGYGAASPGLLNRHGWLGTTAGIWLFGTAIAAQCDARRGRRSVSVRLMLLAAFVMTALAAHFGGLLVHGEAFFDTYSAKLDVAAS